MSEQPNAVGQGRAVTMLAKHGAAAPRVPWNHLLAPPVSMPSVCIRCGNGCEQQRNSNDEQDAAEPEDAPRYAPVGLRAKPKDSERPIVAWFSFLLDLACGEPEVERSCNDSTAAEQSRKNKKTEGPAKHTSEGAGRQVQTLYL